MPLIDSLKYYETVYKKFSCSKVSGIYWLIFHDVSDDYYARINDLCLCIGGCKLSNKLMKRDEETYNELLEMCRKDGVEVPALYKSNKGIFDYEEFQLEYNGSLIVGLLDYPGLLNTLAFFVPEESMGGLFNEERTGLMDGLISELLRK